ncbi:MAG: VWA domain-containing protein [Planctomycetota bacterium]
MTWQADRFVEDFWAGSEGDAQPYFVRSAGAYLEQAEAVAPTAASWIPLAKQSLERKASLANALELKASETLLRFRGGDEQTFDLDITRPGDYPAGVATLRATVREPEKATISIARITSGGSRVPVTLTRQGSAATATSVDAELLFRGHSSRLALPLELPDYEVGPTVVYENRRIGNAKISVRLREFETSNRKILFVLDCSGSMRPKGGKDKLSEMSKILADFAASVEDRTVDVGIRLLGHRVPWVGNPPPELLPDAMRDTELVLPIAPFEREKFDEVLRRLAATGGTPLYRAVADARNDLEKVPGEDKVILIISDGEDIFLGQAGYPSIKSLQDSFAGSGIEVNAIGFGFEARDDFSQLQSLVKIGSGTGEAKKVDSGKGLLEAITRLSGVYTFVAKTETKSFPPTPQRLGVVDKAVVVPPGAYDLQVLNTRDQLVDQRSPLRVDAGEWHKFVLRARKIEYEYNDFPDASARVDSSQSGVALRILEARPIQRRGKATGQGLFLKLALFKKEDPVWRPRDVRILVYPRDQELLYTCQDLTWNEPDYFLPVWGVVIEDWPENTRDADIEVRWSDPGDPAPVSYRISMDDWRKKKTAGKLPEGVQIASWVSGQTSVDQQTKNTTRVLLEFPANFPRFQEWCVNFGEQPIDYARQVYNAGLGVYAGRFILRNEEDPRELVINPPREPEPGKSLKTKFRIGGNPLFQN